MFCAVARGDVAADVVFADEHVVAFLDHRPLFTGHTLVVPRTHVVTLADLPRAEVEPFWRRVQHLSAEVPRAMGAEGTFVANNNVVTSGFKEVWRNPETGAQYQATGKFKITGNGAVVDEFALRCVGAPTILP